jgi:uncharacterized protein YbgA (DUF1722 family)/uncharacterized protein YbbK (DUF523 family)
MSQGEPEKIRLGISACLLGAQVRYDGGHKRDAFLTETLGPFVEWVPVCPEVEIGLGVPRDTLRLVGDPASPRLVVPKSGEDLTARMQRWARARTEELAALRLHGYVLKRASPSCGLHRVPVHGEARRDRVSVHGEPGSSSGDGTSSSPGAAAPAGAPSRGGRGLFAAALVERFPALPVEEEGRLNDPAIRENFIERVFAAARWQRFLDGRPRPRDLVAFHAAHKFAVLAHSPRHYATLGRLVASAGRALTPARLDEYGALLMEALAVRATPRRHVNALQHLAGFFKRSLPADERAELAETIDEYGRGLLPLVVPVALIRHHVRRFRVAYLADQVYLRPHPKELMLRNHV